MMLRTISHGDTGVEASALRGLLGMHDGDTYDAEAAAKVIALQGKHGLTPDGIVGPDTWTALARDAPTLRPGASGPRVRALQYLLGGVKVDGKHGRKTKAAVNAYRRAVGLPKGGACGPKVWRALIIGQGDAGAVAPSTGSTVQPSTGKFGKPKDFKQGAKPWGKKMYSSTGNKKQTYANSGCGPTAAANIVYSMKDKAVTPETLGNLALKWGHRTANSGTAWAFFKRLAEHYKFSRFTQTKSLATLKAAIDSGALAVASMGPGYWTKGGHFITIYDYDEKYIYANDPASSKRKKQAQADFAKQCKQLFIFWP